MRISVATRFAVLPVCAIILLGVLAPAAHAVVTIEIGDYRDLALDFVQWKFGVSREQALSVVHHYEQMHGSRIIDRLELPEGAVLDFVTVDGRAADPDCMVTYEGSGILRTARPQLFYPRIQEVLEKSPPGERQHIMENIRSALERGWFVQEITPAQRQNLLNSRAPGEAQMRPQAVRRVRILVVLNNFPHWDDRAPSRSTYDSGGPREHPVSEPESWHTPAGPLSTSDLLPAGLANPAWSATGMAPAGGTNAAVTNHPRIEYTVNGRTGTSVDLQERWYNFLFDLNNPLSVANYYFANSHANLSIEGNRSDIVGPLESHHILDRIPYLGGAGHNYAVQPGTPVIRAGSGSDYMGVPGLRGLSLDSGTDLIGTIGWTSRIPIQAVQRDTDNDGSGWDALAIDLRAQPIGNRYVVDTAGFDSDDGIQVLIGGSWVNITSRMDLGFSLSDTLLTSSDVLGSDEGNRLLSMCYYTHDHIVTNGSMGERPYQLRHLRNSAGRVDDIIGTVDDPQEHYRRPKPYDHDHLDHAAPNMGYFENPNSNGGHTYGVWLSHLDNVMADHGIVPTGYDCRIALYPSDAAGSQDTGGTSGPWSGAHVFIPNSAVVLPSDAGLYLTAHELGHALCGFPDLYDLDFYTNVRGASPPEFECSMMGPYSVMAHGGRRVDAYLKALVGWVTPVAVTTDIVNAPVPEIEGTLEDPIVYKLPGRPHYIANGVPPSEWLEFFLVENRNRTGTDYFNDISPRGLYIYHVDLRFSQRPEANPRVIVEQADGLFELERNPDGQWGDLEGDPFPGSTGNRFWTQFTNPDSYSHGWVSGIGLNSTGEMRPASEEPEPPPPGVLQPGSSTDSFARVANISDPARIMRADLHVVPREVIATQVPIPSMPPTVLQGTDDFLIMHLRFDNDSVAPNLSRGDVELDTIRIDENGSSQTDADVDRLSIWDDTDLNGEFDPAVDTRLASTVFQQQQAVFTGLNYRVPLDEVRDLFVTYDVSPSADASKGVSLGAGIANFDYIRPEIPGAVQRRVREPITSSNDGLGDYRFPINSQLVAIEEAPDTITVTPISRAPLAAASGGLSLLDINPGDTDVPILSLNFEVDQDKATITRIIVDETGTMNAVAHITSTKLYLDNNANGRVDAGETLLDETTFANVAGTERASYDILANPVVVMDGSPKSVLMVASISSAMPLEDPPLTLQFTLQDPSYISLLQPEDIVASDNFPMSSEVVGTPVPNDPPPPPTNVAAGQQPDGTILLTWELSVDDPAVGGGEDDVVEYHIYRSTDPADLVNPDPADVLAVVGAGVTEYHDATAPLGIDLYYMMRAFDGVQEGPNSNIAGPVQATDTGAPVFSNFVPAQGAVNVPIDTTIGFRVTDAGTGVDQSTLVFEVDGVNVIGDPNTTLTPVVGGFDVTYDPPADFSYFATVTVRLQAADHLGNVAPAPGDFLTYDFTITGPPMFSIAGLVTDASGTPEPDVRVEADGHFDITDADGLYEITDLSAGTYTVVPSKTDRAFEPQWRSVTVGPSAVAVNFTALQGFDISGTVRDGGGNPLAGVTISDGLHSTLTGADGTWVIADIPAGTYTVVAQLAGHIFTPPTRNVTVDASTGDVGGLDFVGVLETFEVSGTVRTSAGAGLAGIQVNAYDNGTVVAGATTGASGAYTITGLLPGSYTIRPVDATYAFQPTEVDLDVTADVSNVDFSASHVYSMTLPQGLSFTAVPIVPLDPDVQDAFGADVQVARWDPQNSPPYVMAPSTNPLMLLAPGKGFWTKSPTQRTLDIPGEVYPSTSDLTLNLLAGWNMAGNPYARSLPWERLDIPSGGSVSRFGFIYDAAAGTYRLVSITPGLGGVTVVPANQGFWLRSSASTQVVINAPGAAPASAQVAQQAASRPEGAWLVPIVARAGGVMDAASVAGVVPQAATDPTAYVVDNPPAIGPYVDVFFVGEGGRRLAVDVRPAATAVEAWQFGVTTDMAGVQVELSLPDLSEVPADKTVILVDEDAGKRLYARTMSSYRYDSGEGGTRMFRLEIAERGNAGLMITAAAASATRGGATVTYALSAEAQVKVEVLNIAGRCVATLGGALAPAGVSTVSWNGRSTEGTPCPAGRYLVRISARAEDGQEVGTVVPLSLTR
ncbi:MAG: carboxypeptidase regulatory-like domain-containing protein [Armatimonadota bacterium]